MRRVLATTHRFLGIAGGLLFLLWFISGIAMLWARMPELDEAERLRLQPQLDLGAARVSPVDAARTLGSAPETVRVAMLEGRPVYRFAGDRGWTTVFADDGSALEPLDRGRAMRLARALFPEHAATARHDRRLESPDQWTLQSRGSLPAHRIRLGDADDTWIYLDQRTGELVLIATRGERRSAYLSAVPHWLYFTPLRRHGPFWNALVIALSIGGCVLTLTGLAWGVWQYASNPREASPYSGLMRWHHYGGLAFGLFTFTWVLSGCLSMDPWDWYAPDRPTGEIAAAIAGASPSLDGLTLERLRDATTAITAATAAPLAQLELIWFRSEPYWLGTGAAPRDTTVERRLASALHPERGALTRFDDAEVLAAARSAMPDAPLVDAVWLTQFDAHYYDLHGPAPLPVLRARYGDPQQTWLYLDPSSGTIVRRNHTSSRINRWIYHGLHSFDFPFLRARPALRQSVVVVLSVGGILVVATSLRDGWRRLARQIRQVGRSRRRLR